MSAYIPLHSLDGCSPHVPLCRVTNGALTNTIIIDLISHIVAQNNDLNYCNHLFVMPAQDNAHTKTPQV